MESYEMKFSVTTFSFSSNVFMYNCGDKILRAHLFNEVLGFENFKTYLSKRLRVTIPKRPSNNLSFD